MKIINTFNSQDGSIAYVEFIHNGTIKILSKETFEYRFGNTCIDDFKRGRSSQESLHVRLSLQENKSDEVAIELL